MSFGTRVLLVVWSFCAIPYAATGSSGAALVTNSTPEMRKCATCSERGDAGTPLEFAKLDGGGGGGGGGDSDIEGGNFATMDQGQGRTFGLRRRMNFLMMALTFKMGMMMTMLVVLTTMSLKSLFMGFVMMLMLLGHSKHSNAVAGLIGHQKYVEAPDIGKNVHIHIHSDGHQPHYSPLYSDHHPEWHSQPYHVHPMPPPEPHYS